MKTKGKSFFQEFKDFAMKGNIIDLAVGVVIGGAFNKIVSSLVKDIIMPSVGLLTGGVNFEYLTLILKPEENGNPAVVLNYGVFIQNVVDFIIIALSIFIMIKVINKLNRKKEEVKEKKISKEEVLLTEIRDVLQELNSRKTVKDDI
ncbi:large-conductance mechanosensitive channel protein MscL [Clostridium chauvoei]|uniref:Large-conductance mechanosensitive channel n=2 Tax=Clostridium chauvoei TaxID=46867 RepID=S6FCS4_9CLOT|nr:large-conductance mechanosensitive channel protein MscL [Clostridium chauvoei]ATD56063.1 large-conductance mechanosensitive channel [Clostridium chauvoei]ATD58554.1 large-conductance mechanosensitive channel [Clostridium chauvoei]MBX7281374.1 large-conductance mechanosensitive channel protein MscL [Clostridium chauvoei]MBX7283918.1 large-conductance mechanosensitive channel protein MscL [Clostridium chauvoei]MBX7286463.1 large-conductance mechanosensitive channel protein MscL [Clostridium c